MKSLSRLGLNFIGLAFVAQISWSGELLPPGPPAPTMHSLAEIYQLIQDTSGVVQSKQDDSLAQTAVVQSGVDGLSGVPAQVVAIANLIATLDTTSQAILAAQLIANTSLELVCQKILSASAAAALSKEMILLGIGGVSQQVVNVQGAVNDISATQRIPIAALPYTINTPGSYVVTKDMVGASGQHGITINSNHVALDLNGFTLHGVTGSLNGIHILTGSSRRDVVIRNGGVFNWDGNGVDASLCFNMQVSDVIVSECALDGIRVGKDGIVKRCSVYRCSLGQINRAGIWGDGGNIVSECRLHDNGGLGIFVGDNPGAVGESIVERCGVSYCTSVGIKVTDACIIKDCQVDTCGTHNIVCRRYNVVTGNSSVSAGINSATGAAILALESWNRIEDNNCNNSDIGIATQGGSNVIIKNTVLLNTTPFSLTGTNSVGPSIGLGDISSTNPWANITF